LVGCRRKRARLVRRRGARDVPGRPAHPPVRLFDKRRFCKDVAHLIASNTRDPASIIGDIQARAQATQVCEREILRLVGKYGRDTVETGLAAVQDYVERSARQRIAALPDGEWETVDFIDRDPAGGERSDRSRAECDLRLDRLSDGEPLHEEGQPQETGVCRRCKARKNERLHGS
jgi:hypothetical protein